MAGPPHAGRRGARGSGWLAPVVRGRRWASTDESEITIVEADADAVECSAIEAPDVGEALLHSPAEM